MSLVGCWLLVLAVQSGAYAQKETIHFATANYNYKPAFERIIEEYEKLNPSVDVQLSVVPENFETWIRTKFAAGLPSAPDVYNGEHTQQFARQGKWVSLNPYLEKINPYTKKPWRDTLDMKLLDRYRISGQLYPMSLDRVEIGIVYNKGIFDRLGLEEPETWEELLAASAVIQDADIHPFAVPGNSASFTFGTVNWISRFFTDAYTRDFVPLVMSQPGDWDYDPVANADFELDLSDRYNDSQVVINDERLYRAIRDGDIRFDSPRFRSLYDQLYTFSQFWQPGYMGIDADMATQLFVRQDAAMMFEGSHIVITMEQRLAEIPEDRRFAWDVMPIPPITEDPYCLAPFRGVGGVGTYYTITDKSALDPGQPDRVADFLMFLTSPQMGRVLVEETLENDFPIIGPLAMTGVELPGDLEEAYEVYLGRGYEKLTFNGVRHDQQSTYDWSVLAQEFLGDRMSLDEFLETYHRTMNLAIPRVVQEQGLDLDPTTPDDEGFDVLPQKNLFNPFENGPLMVFLLLALFAGLLGFSHWRSKALYGSGYTSLTFLFLGPTFLLLIIFNFFPSLAGLYYGFTEWRGGSVPEFNGLANFRRLFQDPYVLEGIDNLILLLVTGLLKATLVPFIAAELLLLVSSERLRSFFRTAFLIPMVAPAVVMILIWKFVYAPNIGLLNNILAVFGLEEWQRVWLGDPATALWSIVFIGFPWVEAIGLLIYLAALTQISGSIMESYRLESNSVLKRIWYIDCRLVVGQTKLLIVLGLIKTLQEFFSLLIMTDGGPGMATMVPALRMYHSAFRFSEYGYGAAIGFTLFIVILALSIANNFFLKADHEGR